MDRKEAALRLLAAAVSNDPNLLVDGRGEPYLRGAIKLASSLIGSAEASAWNSEHPADHGLYMCKIVDMASVEFRPVRFSDDWEYHGNGNVVSWRELTDSELHDAVLYESKKALCLWGK